MEEGADLQGFTPTRAHVLLREVYGDSPHHNVRTHLTGRVPYDALWKKCWTKLAAQLSSWYSTPSGKAGCRFTKVLDAEWCEVIDHKWNSERPLVFPHVVLTRTLSARKARYI